MEIREYPESRALSKVGGDSYGGTVPKSVLEERGMIDDDGEPVAEGTPFETDTGAVGIMFHPIDDE